jgi:hypothetical protein
MTEPKDLKRENLANYRITFHEDPDHATLQELPERVHMLRYCLLSFQGRLVREHIKDLQDETKDIPDGDDPYMVI